MSVSTQESAAGVPVLSANLKEIATDVVRRAMQGGATAAERGRWMEASSPPQCGWAKWRR